MLFSYLLRKLEIIIKDFVSRWAALKEIRVEYFRGKDFVSFMRNHSELKDILESDRSLEPEDIANILLKKKLLVRCDRVVKAVRPGKKKLSAFPSHLEIYDVSVNRYCVETQNQKTVRRIKETGKQ
ncbi:hypothetical protein A4A49_25220 [Nicotiana attenuata]|uniref:Translocation protein SEC62 n=1 Tax=Nicotiana attenuata TaxID=49451 RepID=A0A314L2G0_NICAT|nr:hypothetical protein A4A49_25220 [Nicotiana attenuata]